MEIDQMRENLRECKSILWELSPHEMHAIAISVDRLLKGQFSKPFLEEYGKVTDKEWKSLCALSDILDELPVW